MGQGPAGDEYFARHFDPKDSLAARVGKWPDMPFDFEPGTQTGYSGLVGFDILGRVIEIVSGMDVQTYFRQNIFEPLDIRDITFTLTPQQEARVVRLYEAENGLLTDVTATDPVWKLVNPMVSGSYSTSGGLLGTLPDYAKIVGVLAGEGMFENIRLLKAETVRQMRVESSKQRMELVPGVVWGLSMIVFGPPEQTGTPLTAGTFGWSGAFGTHFFINVAKKIEVVLMLNRSNIGGAASYISREVEKLVCKVYGT